MKSAAPSRHPAASAFSYMAAALRDPDRRSQLESEQRHEETEARLRYLHWFEARWIAEAFIIDRLSVREVAEKFDRSPDAIWTHIRRITHMAPRQARVHYSLHGWTFSEPAPTTLKPGRKPRCSAHTENRI